MVCQVVTSTVPTPIPRSAKIGLGLGATELPALPVVPGVEVGGAGPAGGAEVGAAVGAAGDGLAGEGLGLAGEGPSLAGEGLAVAGLVDGTAVADSAGSADAEPVVDGAADSVAGTAGDTVICGVGAFTEGDGRTAIGVSALPVLDVELPVRAMPPTTMATAAITPAMMTPAS